MADGIARAPGNMPVSPGVAVMADGIARAPGNMPVSPGVAVMADGIARSSGEMPASPLALSTPRVVPSASEILIRAPERELSAAPVGAAARLPVCPFLGLRDDPTTRYDFPDALNRCHAISGRGAKHVASRRRLVPGRAGTERSQPIEAGHQESLCLTAAHEHCARYRAAEVVAAKQ